MIALGACGAEGTAPTTDAPTGGIDAAAVIDAAPLADASIPQDAINDHIGDPCTTSSECPDNGYCVEGADGNVCTYECVGDCPFGYHCRVADIDGALVSVCVPTVPRHCFPCTADDQCPGGSCLQLEGSGYCVASCFESGCAEEGTTCGPDPSGEHPGSFCVPDTGSCSCSAETDGDVRACSNMNAIGTCWGVETCDAKTGWGSCNAPTATDEVCDGVDNDCDSIIDDGVGAGSACTNDVPGVGSCDGQSICTGAAGLICQAPTPVTETCNYTDDDCDTMVDEGFANLGSTCAAGTGACERFGVIACNTAGDGTECSAVAGTPINELCNGVDDDCMGDVDEDFTDLGDSCTVGMGICERVGQRICSSGGAGTECSATPGPADPTETCNTLDDNCNGQVDEGFKNQTTGLYDQDTTCGSCAVDCTAIYNLPNASGTCVVSGTPGCVMGCNTNTFNLNGVIADGCEFVLDQQAIYVSTSDPGADDGATCGLGPVGTGTNHRPCLTIAQGQARASGLGRVRVLVSNGIYNAPVTLTNGIGLLGGYQWDTWERDVAATGTQLSGVMSIGSHDITVMATNITSSTLFEGFIIVGAVNGATGGNSYGVYVSGSNANLTMRNNVVIAGRGGPGSAGTPGGDGSNGTNGTGRTSNPTIYDAKIATGTGFCNTSNNRSHSNGGVLTCGTDNVNGGAGGGNRCTPSPNNEFAGIDGTTGQPGAGAGGGAGGGGADAGDDMDLEDNASLCYLPWDAINMVVKPDYGQDGARGGNGGHGAAVSGCTATAGVIVGGHWRGNGGANGNAASNGGGGGGGGAGGGSFCSWCPENKDRLGGHGGGGGSGGCGGTGGTGATAGGGAFAIFVFGGTAPVITDNTITRGDGGTGGTGGGGGTGGDGGGGATGGTTAVFCAGRAARGGNGGDGGHGSGGGGGCGGGSYGIYTFGVGSPNYCTGGAANQINGGVGGAGGAGGYSIANPGGVGNPGNLDACSYN